MGTPEATDTLASRRRTAKTPPPGRPEDAPALAIGAAARGAARDLVRRTAALPLPAALDPAARARDPALRRAERRQPRGPRNVGLAAGLASTSGAGAAHAYPEDRTRAIAAAARGAASAFRATAAAEAREGAQGQEGRGRRSAEVRADDRA